MMNRNLMLMMAMAVLLPIAGLADIDPAERYAWSSQTGWQDWRATHGGVTVLVDGANGYLAGDVWSPTIGWISLGSGTGPYANTDETNWGVNLDASGNLSGYAWSSQTGWINFNPTHGQVTIDTITGQFHGHAWSPTIGWIGFRNDSPAYGVRTTAYDKSVPAAPTDVNATPGSTRATVSWTAPTDTGGSPITGYTITGQPDGSCSVAGDITECTITGLTNGTEYTFTVIATNAVGDSLPSAPSNIVVPSELLFRDRFQGD